MNKDFKYENVGGVWHNFFSKKTLEANPTCKTCFFSYWEVRKNRILNKYKKIAKCWKG